MSDADAEMGFGIMAELINYATGLDQELINIAYQSALMKGEDYISAAGINLFWTDMDGYTVFYLEAAE